MKFPLRLPLVGSLALGLSLSSFLFPSPNSAPLIQVTNQSARDQALALGHDETAQNALSLLRRGREVFRNDSLGSESFWGDQLRVHETIAGSENGGVGPGLSPLAALSVGLKVDAHALPKSLREDLIAGRVDLDDPAVTLALLSLNAVIGLQGFFEGSRLKSVGISCALCHSTVDDALLPGIGRRQDGHPNRDLDVGRVIGLAQDLSPLTDALGLPEATVRAVLDSWGPGRFDAHLLLDGQAFRPDGASASVLIPAAMGLGGVNLATYNGWGSVSHWNALVGTLEMGGQGRFFDPRLNDPLKYPVATAEGAFDVTPEGEDRLTPNLAALQLYQNSLVVPAAPEASYDAVAARRGEALFNGRADCARCHVPPLFTEPGWNAHTGAEIGIDEFQALRSPIERYRTTPLRGLFLRAKGGYFHDGRFADLPEVIEHYNSFFTLQLSEDDVHDLTQYLKSI